MIELRTKEWEGEGVKNLHKTLRELSHRHGDRGTLKPYSAYILSAICSYKSAASGRLSYLDEAFKEGR